MDTDVALVAQAWIPSRLQVSSSRESEAAEKSPFNILELLNMAGNLSSTDWVAGPDAISLAETRSACI
jgi:hypothetical protein